MSEQESNLESTQENANNSGISDKERQGIVIVIKILSVLTIILTGFIIEALINQHPVFEFLHYTIFKQESIILGSISISFLFLGYLVLGIALGNLLLVNFKFNKTIFFIFFSGVSLIFTYFILLYQNYNWELGYLNYFAGLLAVTGATGQVMVEIINKSQSSLSYYKLLKLISLILWICGLCLEGIYYSKQNL